MTVTRKRTLTLGVVLGLFLAPASIEPTRSDGRVAGSLLGVGSPLFAQSGTSEYAVIELPTLPPPLPGDRGSSSSATGINDAGQIVGLMTPPFTFDAEAVLWDHGSLIRLPVAAPGGFSVRATDINEHGQVIGYAISPGLFSLAVLWEGGTAKVLGGLGGS